jgi:hypothetical protein
MPGCRAAGTAPGMTGTAPGTTGTAPGTTGTAPGTTGTAAGMKMPAGLLGERGTVSPASKCTITSPATRAGELGQHRALRGMVAGFR